MWWGGKKEGKNTHHPRAKNDGFLSTIVLLMFKWHIHQKQKTASRMFCNCQVAPILKSSHQLFRMLWGNVMMSSIGHMVP